MSLDAAIYAKVTSVATATIGTRMYPSIIPAKTRVGGVMINTPMPAVTYQRISTVPFRSHDGPSGLVRARFEIVAWADTNVAAKGLADVIRVGLDCIGWTTGGDVVQVAWVDGEMLVYEDNTTTDEPRYGVAMEFLFLHNETT
jgi:hypothetical protein